MKKKTLFQRAASGFLALLLLFTAVIGGVTTVTAEEAETVYTWRETTAERDLYYDDYTTANIGKVYSGETIEEILQMIEDPSVEVDLDGFFSGTCFEGCTQEDLEWFLEEGYTLEGLIGEISDAGASSVWNYLYGIMMASSYASGTVSFFNSSVTVTIPELNRVSHAFYYMKINGYVAFCLDSGKHMYSGTVLDYDSESAETIYKQAIAYYDSYNSTVSMAYEYAQMYVWTGGDQSTFLTAMSQLYYCLLNGDADSATVISGAESLLSTGFYYTALGVFSNLSNMSTSNVNTYVYATGNSTYQRLVCGYLEETPPVYGAISLIKVDADTGSSTPQGNASLDGAVYGLYAREDIYDPTDGYTVLYAAGTQVATATVASGAASFGDEIAPGSYYIKEVTAPAGYRLSGTEYDVTVSATEATSVTVTASDNIQRGNVEITKVDSDWGKNSPQGDASLAGAVYAVVNNSANAVYVDGKTYASGETVMTITTDSTGYASGTGLPYGSYSIYEVSASTGYLVDSTKKTFSITSDGQTVSFTSGEMIEEVQRGNVEITKVDSDWGKNSPQGDASLAGAVYAVVNNSANAVYVDGKTYASGETVMTITTDSTGYASVDAGMLPYGSYYIYEVSASTGYLVDSTKHYFTIRSSGQTYSFTSGEVTEPVIRGGLSFQKYDAESLLAKEQGGADFEGLVLEVTNISASPVYVDGATYAPGEVVATLVTDENGYASLPDDTLPYGTYTITEVGYLDESGEVVYVDEGDALGTSGYLRLGTLSRTFTIRTNGQVADISSSADTGITNTVIRGDIVLRKIDADTQQALAGVQFKITLYDKDGNAVESHIVTTDENGQYDSSSSYASHSAANGLWFGDSDPDDSRGALPYGTYTIEELEGTANAGRTMYSDTFTISNKTNAAGLGYKVDLGNLENVLINLSTMAQCEETGSQYAIAGDNIVLVDTVFYDHLTVGREYTLKAYVADADTGELLLDAGGELITGTAIWTANLSSGYRTVDIVLDASSLAGKTLVVYEYLYYGDLLLVSHEDPEDTDQMIYVCGISTSALSADSGTQMPYAGGTVTIVDTVSYYNLKPQRSYVMSGVLMDKETGRELTDADGEVVTAEVSFTPAEKDGTVEVTFTFEAPEDLAGKVAVVYETLYRADLYHTVWASHEDLSDYSQSIFFPQIGTEAALTGTAIEEGRTIFTVTDTVSYVNLIPGVEYTVTGVLMDQETGKELLDAETGVPVTAETSFTPETSDGSCEVTFTFDGTGYSGVSAVAFEELSVDGYVIAEHKDITDGGQTVELPLPQIGTAAALAGRKTVNGRTIFTVTDTVAYVNLIPGVEYTVTGVLMDKETGKELLDAETGVPVTAETSFTPDTSDGSCEVTFTFDGTGYSGVSAVAFEELSVDGYVIAEHKDITDEGQTVELSIPEKKKTTTTTTDTAAPEPEEPETEGPEETTTPQTGDTARGWLYGALALGGLLISCAGYAASGKKKRGGKLG